MNRLRFLWVGVLGSLLLLVPQTANAGWMRTYGGEAQDIGQCVQQVQDGGYIITGYTSSFSVGNWDVWLLKTDDKGNTLWARTYGGLKDDEGYFVQQTNDGGYIITGSTDNPDTGNIHLWILKTDTNGEALWTKEYGGSGDDKGKCVQQTTDGNYIIVGYTYSTGPGGKDLWLLKTDPYGDTLWTKIYGLEGYAAGYSVQETSDGGYVVTGGRNGDVWLLKTDVDGDTLWTRTYGMEWEDEGCCVQGTDDNGYIVVASTVIDTAYGLPDHIAIWLLKTDSLGDTLWTRIYGEEEHDWAWCVQQTNDSGYIITGHREMELWLLKTNVDGDTLWTRSYGDGGLSWDIGYWVQETEDSGYIIVGSTESFGAGKNDLWLIKTEANGDTLALIEEPISENSVNWEVVPSIGPQIVLRYRDRPDGFHASIFDATGRKVDEIKAGESSGTITWGKCYGPGVYFIRVTNELEGSKTSRVIIIH